MLILLAASTIDRLYCSLFGATLLDSARVNGKKVSAFETGLGFLAGYEIDF